MAEDDDNDEYASQYDLRSKKKGDKEALKEQLSSKDPDAVKTDPNNGAQAPSSD